VESNGQTNLLADAGAIRFWFKPDWTSSTLSGGTGPGTTATLVEIGAASGNQSVAIWSLQASADGSTLSLVAQSDDGPVPLLCAQVSWQAGQWYLLTVNYDSGGTALVVGDQWAAQSTATLVIPPTRWGPVLGQHPDGKQLRWRRF
jgi:hypothetical protein